MSASPSERLAARMTATTTSRPSMVDLAKTVNQASREHLGQRLAKEREPAEPQLPGFERPHQPELQGFPEAEIKSQKAIVKQAEPGTTNRAFRETRLDYMLKAGRSP